MISCVGAGTSLAILTSHGTGRRHMAHTPSWVTEGSLMKGLLGKVWAESKESNRDGAAPRTSISRESLPPEA